MIHTLPPEVWFSIFEYLCWPQHELASMMYISPYTKDIVEALLYKKPRIGHVGKEMEISHLVEQFHRTATKGDGHLANVVQALHLARVFQSNSQQPVPEDTCLTASLLLSLRNLKYLDVAFFDVALAPPTVTPSCQFTSITHLSYRSDVKDPVSFAAFLGSLPALEYMQSGGDRIGSIPLASAALPLLRHLDNASFDFAVSVLTGRQVPHVGLENNHLQPLIPLVNGSISPTLRDTLQCVQSLSIVSDDIDPMTLITCASLFKGMKHLKILSDQMIESLNIVIHFTGILKNTQLEFFQVDLLCDDKVESVKTLFSQIPTLKIFDFGRMTVDAEDGYRRFRRDKLNEESEIIGDEPMTEWDRWWVDIEPYLEDVEY